uniref:Putative ovule protein n=1 Tax=Solanum chacoense TaxID=4108 RepID=A0A0V0GMZ7_SOLCH
MEIINEHTKESRLEQVKIQYDMLPKYCMNCKVQGHAEDECRVLHPELKLENTTKNYAEDMDKKIRENTNNDTRRRKRVMPSYSNPTNRRFTREGHIGESS